MDPEELEPKKKTPKPKNLEEMSVEALHDYIEELEMEIERVRRELAAKKSARVGAEALFGGRQRE